jgi:hemoglobin-like flavoprotein
MTPTQIQLVQSTWAKVVPIKDAAAEIFYGKLFEMDPALRPLFKGDLKAQGAKLMSMINTAVNGLTRLDQIVPAVESLGKRHVGYGVKDQHYDTVAGALLYTLEKGLGPAFTQDVKQSWTEAYMLLAGVMKKAASTVPA